MHCHRYSDAFGGNAYRSIYVVKLAGAIYVLHAVMKKSKSGRGIPREDIRTIELRLKQARLQEEDYAMARDSVRIEKSSGNVFLDIASTRPRPPNFWPRPS